MSYEKPRYTVEKKDGKFEIRDYEGYILAQVEVKSDYSSATSQGFRALFNYIVGDNAKRSKIAMTVPVTQEVMIEPEQIPMTGPVSVELTGANDYNVAFMMPSGYTMDTLPEPNNKGITFKEVKPHRSAALRFSGYMDGEKAMRRIAELKEWMAKNGLKPKSHFTVARYDPPWIPGFLRNNEVIVEI
jgi:hypothetical protein